MAEYPPTPEWLVPGARIDHPFGFGTVQDLRFLEGRPAILIDFDELGAKLIDFEMGLPVLSPVHRSALRRWLHSLSPSGRN